MVRRVFYLEVSAGKVSLWCFVIETSLQISSESYVFESSSSPELITKQKKQSNLLPLVLKKYLGVTEILAIDTVLSVQTVTVVVLEFHVISL